MGVDRENRALVYRALFAKTGKRVHLDDALEAVGGALEEYNKKAKAACYIEKAGRLRAEFLAMKGTQKTARPKNFKPLFRLRQVGAAYDPKGARHDATGCPGVPQPCHSTHAYLIEI
jgi:hypothetical protein